MANIAVGDKVRPKLTLVGALSFGVIQPQPPRFAVAVTVAAGAISALGEDGSRLPTTGTVLAVSFDRIIDPLAIVRDFWLDKVVEPFSASSAFSFEYAMKVVDVFAVDTGVDPAVVRDHRILCRFLKGTGWFELQVSSTPGAATDPTILTDR
jgi:hypothetical protein